MVPPYYRIFQKGTTLDNIRGNNDMSSNNLCLKYGDDVSDTFDGFDRSSIGNFPLDFFPEKYRVAIEEIARSVKAPVQIPALALISACGASIGRTRAIQVNESWREYANLYIGIVGGSGIGKTPATNHIFKHLDRIENEWYETYMREKDNGVDADWRQIRIDDATTEALPYALRDNPRGILWNRDELAGMFKDMDKYTKGQGATKERLMTAYDSGSWKINRVDRDKNLYIKNATLSIYGTIQPAAFSDIFKLHDIEVGFIPRFIFVFVESDSPPFWTDDVVSQKTEQSLSHLFRELLAYDFDDQGNPLSIDISSEGMELFIEWHDRIIAESWYDVNADTKSALNKKTIVQCLRLALIAHFMDAVANNSSPMNATISRNVIERAIKLSDFFKIHKYCVVKELQRSKLEQLSSIVKLVAQAIIKLEDEISKGMLTTERITMVINEGLEDRYHVNGIQVGKAYSKLYLKSKQLPDGKKRGVEVTPDDINRLKTLIGNPSNPSNPSE